MKTRRLAIRLSKEERDAFRRAAAQRGLPLSEWVRRCALDQAGRLDAARVYVAYLEGLYRRGNK